MVFVSFRARSKLLAAVVVVVAVVDREPWGWVLADIKMTTQEALLLSA